MSKSGTHSLKDSPLQVQYADRCSSRNCDIVPNKLLLRDIPKPQDTSYDIVQFELYLEKALKLMPSDFTVNVTGSSAVVTFTREYSIKGNAC